ncbi:MAG: metallophosphoesterase [Sulfuricaulis sp.]
MRNGQRPRVMTLFPVIVLAYAAMQLYAIWKVSIGAGLAPDAVTGLVVWVMFMTLMPFLLWRLERTGWHRPVVAGAWVGYLWMGLIFLFFLVALSLDLLGAAVKATGILLHLDMSNYMLSPRQAFLLTTAISLGLVGYGFVAALRQRVEHITLSSSKLPAGNGVLRIVQISDVHLGAIVGARRLRKILEKVRDLKPDILVSTGDLIDGQADHLNGLPPLFEMVQPRLGKFAVTGNHEFYVGYDRSLDFTRRCGFTVLSGEALTPMPNVTIAGIDDPAGRMLGVSAQLDDPALLAALPHEHFTILLKHQPVVDPRAAEFFDLQLSGHVHQGQIFPFGLLVRLIYPMHTGLTCLALQKWLYISRGTGTWGPPMRVFAPPEITLIEVIPVARLR